MKVTMYYPDSLELSDFAAFLRLQEGADLHRGVARGFLFDEERNQDNKIKDRVRAPEMEGNRVRKRKKTAVFFRVSACRIFKIKKQNKKKRRLERK